MIRLDDAAIQQRFHTDRGLTVVARQVAEAVERRARANASGPILGIRTGDLLASIFVRTGADARGVFAQVGANAIHRGFPYPGFHDANGRPWLSQALVETVGAANVRPSLTVV